MAANASMDDGPGPPEALLARLQDIRDRWALRFELHESLRGAPDGRPPERGERPIEEMRKIARGSTGRGWQMARPSESFGVPEHLPPKIPGIPVGPPVPPAYLGVPSATERLVVLCDRNETLAVEQAGYWESEAGGGRAHRIDGSKGARAEVAAGPNQPQGPGQFSVAFGFVSSIPVAASSDETTIRIRSAVNVGASWAEANSFHSGPASIRAITEMSALVDGEVIAVAPGDVLDADTVPDEVFVEYTGPIATVVRSLEVVAPAAASATDVVVFESGMVMAATNEGHAFVDLSFAWDPVTAELRTGCRTMVLPGWGYANHTSGHATL